MVSFIRNISVVGQLVFYDNNWTYRFYRSDDYGKSWIPLNQETKKVYTKDNKLFMWSSLSYTSTIRGSRGKNLVEIRYNSPYGITTVTIKDNLVLAGTDKFGVFVLDQIMGKLGPLQLTKGYHFPILTLKSTM